MRTLDISDTDLWGWIQGYLEAASVLSPDQECRKNTGRAAELLWDALEAAEKEEGAI